jgi:hypothetical protein
MNGNNKPKWQVSSITDFGDQPVRIGIPRFGFHVHTGECYHLHYEKGYTDRK